MDSQIFLDNFEIIAESPGGIDRLRNLILNLAVQGRLNEGASLRELSSDGLPSHWTRGQLENFADYIQRGKGPKYVDRSPVPVVSQKCVKWSGFDLSEARFVDPLSLSSYKEDRFLRAGDLLWNSTGTGTVGRTALFVPSDKFSKVVADSHVTVVRTTSLVPQFLWCWSASPVVQAQVLGATTGSTNQQELSLSTIKSLPIAFPTEDEQQEIVERVDQLMLLCDELEAAKNKRDSLRTAARKSAIDAISTATTPDELTQSWRRISGNWISLTDSQEGLASLRSLIIELAVQGRLSEGASLRELSSDGLPSHWTRGQLENFADYIQRGKGPKYVDRSPVPVVSQKCVKWSGFDLSEARFVDPLSLSSYKEDRFLRAGDLLWNSTGTGTVGRTALFVPSDKFSKVVADSHVTVVRTTSLVPQFLWCWSASPVVQAQVLGATTGSTNQQELSLSTIKSLPIAFPTEDEQQEIVERVDQLMLLCDELEKSLETRLTIQQNLALSVSQFA